MPLSKQGSSPPGPQQMPEALRYCQVPLTGRISVLVMVAVVTGVIVSVVVLVVVDVFVACPTAKKRLAEISTLAMTIAKAMTRLLRTGWPLNLRKLKESERVVINSFVRTPLNKSDRHRSGGLTTSYVRTTKTVRGPKSTRGYVESCCRSEGSTPERLSTTT